MRGSCSPESLLEEKNSVRSRCVRQDQAFQKFISAFALARIAHTRVVQIA
jgi:hypothetical protein